MSEVIFGVMCVLMFSLFVALYFVLRMRLKYGVLMERSKILEQENDGIKAIVASLASRRSFYSVFMRKPKHMQYDNFVMGWESCIAYAKGLMERKYNIGFEGYGGDESVFLNIDEKLVRVYIDKELAELYAYNGTFFYLKDKEKGRVVVVGPASISETLDEVGDSFELKEPMVKDNRNEE